MKFSYVEFLGLAEERIFRPMIPVTFSFKKESFPCYALIDSGADYSILPIEIAGIFQFKLSDQPQYNIQGAGGNTFTIYKSPEKIDHSIQNKGFRDIKWSSYVYFAESGSTILLGQKGFLDCLKVTLNGPKKEIEVSMT